MSTDNTRTQSDVSLELIKEAHQRICSLAPPSPVRNSWYISAEMGISTYLKLENLNVTGSFKIRGASNALLLNPKEACARGVVAASAGNHAQGIAHVCRKIGAKATIFMPLRTPMVKAESTRSLGAEVNLTGLTYDDAFQAAQEYQKKNNSLLVHPFADAPVICGQGTIGLELLEQIPDLGMVIVPIGGGGLIGGIGCAIKETNPSISIIGVQAAAYPAMYRSLKENHLVACPPAATIADGIAVKKPWPINFALAKKYVDDVVLVEEEEIAAAIMTHMERNHLLVEGAGATSLAALRKLPRSTLEKIKGRSICCILGGGNIDVNLLNRISVKGLIHTHRLMRLRMRIPDRPGALANVLNVIGMQGANLIEVQHNRLFGNAHYDEVEIDVDLETINKAHQEKIIGALREKNWPTEALDFVAH